MNSDEISYKVQKDVSEFALQYGFQTIEFPLRKIYVKLNSEYTLRLLAGIGKVWETKGYFEGPNLGIWGRLIKVEELWEDLADTINMSRMTIYDRATFSVQSRYIKSPNDDRVFIKEYPISDEGVNQFIKDLKASLPELIKKVESMCNIAYLDQDVNNKVSLNEDLHSYIISSDGITFRRIILSKLNNNPLYEEICNYERGFFNDYLTASKEKGMEYLKNIPIVFEKVYERLKNI